MITTIKMKALGAAFSTLLLAATNVHAETIKVGVLSPNTGPYAAIGEDVRNGFEMFFQSVGDKAGGKDVKLIFEGSQAKPDVGLTKAKKLVESDKVAFVGGIVSSSVAYAVRDYLVEKKVPLLVSVSSADGLTQELRAPNIFRTNSSGSQTSHPMGKWLADQGYKRVIMVAPGYSMGFEQTGGIARTFTESGGKVVQTLYPPLGTSDYAPFLSKLNVKQADAVIAVFAGSEAIQFVRQFEEYGLKDAIPLVGTSLLTDDMILEKEGDAALGIITSSHYSSQVDTPENKAFVAAYKERYKRLPTLYAEASYNAAKVIHDALEKLGGDVGNQEALLKAIAGVSFKAPRGDFKFDAYNSPIHDIYILKVERTGDGLVNKPFHRYPAVSQFFTWTPEEFMKLPPYRDIANDWVK